MEKSEVEMLREKGIYVIPDGSMVKRKTDGVTGIIEMFFMRFSFGDHDYNDYCVRWSDGHYGIVNNDDFEILNN